MKSSPGAELAGPGSVAGELAWGTAELRRSGCCDPRREALLLWSELVEATPGAVLAGRTEPAGEPFRARFREAVVRRASGEPRQYVVGSVGFRRLILRCDRRALIPRPETEGLVDLALARQPRGRALDLGTGSGCLALALADEGSFAEVVGVDRSEAALELARANGNLTRLPVRWMAGSWVEPVRGERFDVIVTNPPYIATGELAGLDRSVQDWEPALALDGGADGLDAVRRLLSECPLVMAQGGWLLMEVDAARATVTAGLAQASGWSAVQVIDDLYRRPRYLVAQWESHHA